MIEVRNLTKKYGKYIANDDINLSVGSGRLAILLGPNGAGKSTLIKSICGLLRVQGSVTIGGFENSTPQAKRILGYVPEFPTLYPMLTVYEHLEFIAKAYRLEGWREYAQTLLERFELSDKTKKLGKELSKGMQQKVSLCCALLPKPKVVILDEPVVGLDPHGIRELKNVVSDLKNEGCALLVSTHMIDNIEDNWDVTYIMQKGKIARAIHKEDYSGEESLESIYFSVIENSADGLLSGRQDGLTVTGDVK